VTLQAARDTTTSRLRYGPRGRAGDGRPTPAARGVALHRTLPPRPLSTSHTSKTTSHDTAPYCTTIHLPVTFFYPLPGASSLSSPIRSTPRHVEPPPHRPGGFKRIRGNDERGGGGGDDSAVAATRRGRAGWSRCRLTRRTATRSRRCRGEKQLAARQTIGSPRNEQGLFDWPGHFHYTCNVRAQT